MILAFFFLQFVGLVAERGRLLEVLFGDGLFFLPIEGFDFLVDLLQVGWSLHRLEPHAGTRLRR